MATSLPPKALRLLLAFAAAVALLLTVLTLDAIAKGSPDRVSLEEGVRSPATLRVVGPPYLAGFTIDDDNIGNSVGDGDGTVEAGETIELYVELWNSGDQTATGVNATILTSNPYVTFTFNTSSGFGDIAPGGFATNTNDYDFVVDDTTPPDEEIQFALSISASNGGPWTDSLTVPVVANNPRLALISDQTEFVPVSVDLDGIGFDTDVFNNNWNGTNGLFISDLPFLMGFDVVAWYASGYGGGRLTTPAEAQALESYLQAGGRLLVTGYDTIGSPDDGLMAALIRSSSVGDETFVSSYHIVQDTHPIAGGPYGVFPNGFHVMATDHDHDRAEPDTTQGASAVASLESGAAKIIATDLDPAPASGRVAYWNGNLNAMDWLGPTPTPKSSRFHREDKPGAVSNESLRAAAEDVSASDLPAAANLGPKARGLRLDPETLHDLRPTSSPSLRSESFWVFPTSYAAYVLANDPYWYAAGDFVEQVISADPVIERATLQLGLSDNNLNGGNHIELLLQINGLVMGTFQVFEGELAVNVDFVFPAMAGPSFTVRLTELNTVPPGGGSIVIPPGVSTLIFGRQQHELLRNTLAWLGEDATRRDANEVNDSFNQCTPVAYGLPVTGVFVDPAGDWDYYCFNGQAGEGVFLDVDAWEIGSDLDAVLTLFDSSGSVIAQSDDFHGLDPFLTYVLPTTGTYYARVRSWGHPCCGGPDFIYALLVDLGPVEGPSIAPADRIVAGIETISPTPAAGTITIVYGVPRTAPSHHLDVYDVTGRLVRTLRSGPAVVGRHRVLWDGRGRQRSLSASGVYFVSLRLGEERWTRKVMLLR